MSKKTRQQNFIEGSMVLVIATMLVKVLGAVYRIFLTRLIGTDGMGYYSTAYDIYLPIYSIAMSGLPIAVSKIVAGAVAEKKYKQARKVMSVSFKTFIITGTVGSLAMVGLAFIYSSFILKDEGQLLPILAISPCLFFCCLISAYRGYYEGLKDMRPTAISQVIEAAGKLVFGYVFAYIIVRLYGTTTTKALSLAACGALLGIALGTIFASGYLIIKYKKQGDGFTKTDLELSAESDTTGKVFKMLMAVTIPIVLASLVSNITALIDVTMVKRQLLNVIEKNPEAIRTQFAAVLSTNEVAQDVVNATSVEEFAAKFANSLYGMHRGYVYSIYNLVPVITSVFGISAIPTLASAWAKKNKTEIKQSIDTVVRTTSLIAMPLGIGIVSIPWAILNLLYGSDAPVTIEIMQHNLRVLGVCALFCGIVMPLTNMLQAIGKQNIPLITMAIGATIKIITNIVLVGNVNINVYGIPYGTTLCYTFIFVANLICLIKYAKVKFDFMSALVKPFISAAGCGIAAALTFNFIKDITSSKIILVALPIIAAAFVYLILLSITNALSENDIKMLPKGDKIVKILAKLKVIR